MDREPEIKAILQKACDRDWKDETLYQTAVIASNAIYWRDREIEGLRKRCGEALQPSDTEIEDLALRLEIDYREHRYQNCQRAASMLRRLKRCTDTEEK